MSVHNLLEWATKSGELIRREESERLVNSHDATLEWLGGGPPQESMDSQIPIHARHPFDFTEKNGTSALPVQAVRLNSANTFAIIANMNMPPASVSS